MYKRQDITDWPVAAPKAFVGHTIGPASGDQVAMALGIFADNIMPGITTIDKVADDVHDERLNIATEHWHCQAMDVAFINSKGFGGNNATATLFSPAVTLAMMEKRHGSDGMANYRDKNVLVEQARAKYQALADNGEFQIIYRFGDGTLMDDDVSLTDENITVTGFANKIVLPTVNPFNDMV